ncbi:MAG: ATPase [Deltaproteobacteria bacterium]|nr:ATPase [Deltaproteobacteria bacterium]
MADRPLHFLLLASYFKGERFMKRAHAQGVKCWLLTQEKLLQKEWPRESLVEIFAQRNDSPLEHTLNTVSYLARTTKFDRIVALDDFDVEVAAALREHLRVPGMGDTTVRHFRDKLAMRQKARDEGIPVPDFVHVCNYDEIRDFIKRTPAPWMLKPRSEASATGITKITSEEQLWQTLEKLGDRQSHFVLEQYLPGDVFHADSIVWEKEIVFAATHKCGTPPFNVAHGGGIFTTRTVERGSPDDVALRKLNRDVLSKFNLLRGVSHVEFIKGRDDGKFYLLESAARVGGAHIAEVIEAANGINPWEEWASLEIAAALKKDYTVPKTRAEYGGIAISLARQETPDTSAYNDPEIFYRGNEANHVGLVVRSPDSNRVKTLLDQYQERYLRDFTAVMPAAERPGH